MQLSKVDGKHLAPTVKREEEWRRMLERARAEVVRAREQEARARTDEARAIDVAKRLASRLERRGLEAYDKGFETGFAAAVADETRRSEPRRKAVERDREGRIVAITG
jgi:hypothetical protein